MNEISNNLVCILTRTKIEIWMEKERADNLKSRLENQRFVEIDGDIIATSDIVGIYSAKMMEDYKRLRNGQWKCSKNIWHDRGIKCDCKYKKYNEIGQIVEEFIQGMGWVKK